MARTKFTGPKRESSPAPSPTTENANNGAPILTQEGGAEEPTSDPAGQQVVSKTPKRAKSEVPREPRVTKRAKGETKFSKEVLILYEALVHGVDVKVDHAAVARATGTNAPAARMRYTRLMRRIEESLKDGNEQKASSAGAKGLEPADPATKEGSE